jgi:AcrR family transcriptional regulator
VSNAAETSSGRGPSRPLARRREEVLDAATELFAEQGYADADTQQLAERLGVGKGTLYRCFPSKKALFLAAVDRVMRRQRERLDERVAGIDDPLERVAEAVKAFLEFFAEHPRYVELLILERALFKDRKTPTYYEHRERNVKTWQELYSRLIADGRVREMPVERITGVISDLLYGTIFNNYFAGRTRDPADQAGDLLDVVFRGILSGRECDRRTNEPA